MAACRLVRAGPGDVCIARLGESDLRGLGSLCCRPFLPALIQRINAIGE